jgi:hypothetical protein
LLGDSLAGERTDHTTTDGGEWLKSFVLALAVSFLLLACIEVAIRTFWPQECQYHGEPFLLGQYDVRTQEHGVGDTEYPMKPNAKGVQVCPEWSVEYRINQDGLRDESPHRQTILPDTTRMLILGDSFTFGWGVDYPKIWPVVMENELLSRGHKVDIIKAGRPGACAESELRFLKLALPKYRPNIVVIGFEPAELARNLYMTEKTAQQAHDPQSQSASELSKSTWTSFREFIQSYHTLLLVKRFVPMDRLILYYHGTFPDTYCRIPLPSIVERQIDATKELFAQLSDYCRDHGAKLVVVSIPRRFQLTAAVLGKPGPNLDIDVLDKVFSEFAAKHGFEWIPTLHGLANQQRATGQHMFFPMDGHLNENGNVAVGRYVAKHFAEASPAR